MSPSVLRTIRIVAVTLVAGSTTAASRTAASAEPAHDDGLRGDRAPTKIVDGDPVAECAWPSAVQLYTPDDSELRSGVYVGGRIVLTAAHCMNPGWTIELPTPCMSNMDCPNMGEFSDDLDLECDLPGGDTCSSPDDAKSSSVKFVRFGERYPGEHSDQHLRKAVTVAYCVMKSETGNPSDFAYCVLTDDPNVQPVPIMMHCEADQYLPDEAPVVSVGFGIHDPNIWPDKAHGTKRWTTCELSAAYSSSATTLFGQNCNPGWPESGDSGGPLMRELPDGTWRVIGVALTNAPSWNAVWNHVDWMAADPNFDTEAIIPCHTTTGEWCPTAGCGGFPMSPDIASGSWARAPTACYSSDLSGSSSTCTGSMCIQPGEPHPYAQANPDDQGADRESDPIPRALPSTLDGPASSPSACAVVAQDRRAVAPALAAFATLLLLVRRPKRRAH